MAKKKRTQHNPDFVQLNKQDATDLKRLGFASDSDFSASRLSAGDKRFIRNALWLLAALVGMFAALVLVPLKDTAPEAPAQLLIEPKALATLPFSSETVGNFETAIPGLVGWMVNSDEMGNNIVYATPDGDFTVIGVVLDRDGKNVTEEEMIEHLDLHFDDEVTAHAPGQSGGDSSYEEQLEFVEKRTVDGLRVEGTTEQTVWVVIDMNCPYCHELIKQVNEVVATEERHHSVEFVPACVLGLESCAVEGLLNATPEDERLLALTSYVHGKSGAFSQVNSDELEQLAQESFLRAQTFMHEGVHAVPSIFWKDEQGVVRNYMGLPSESVVRQLLTGGLDG